MPTQDGSGSACRYQDPYQLLTSIRMHRNLRTFVVLATSLPKASIEPKPSRHIRQVGDLRLAKWPIFAGHQKSRGRSPTALGRNASGEIKKAVEASAPTALVNITKGIWAHYDKGDQRRCQQG